MIKLSLVCFVLFLGGQVIAENVPALIWGSVIHYTPALALKSYNGDEFIDVLSEHISPNTFTLVIRENQLSTEDFSLCRTPNGRTCFQGIQQLNNKLYLPSVEDALPIIEDVARLDMIEVNLLSNGALSEPLNPEGGKFVFIDFEDNASDESKASKLARHDQLITKLYNKLSSEHQNILVIYTAAHAPQHQKRVVRQAATSSSSTSSTTSATTSATTPTTTAANVPKQEPTQGVFWQRNNLLLYYLGLESVDTNGVATEVPVSNITVDEAVGKLTVTLAAGSNSFAFNITTDGGYWWLSEYIWNGQAVTTSTRIAAVEFFSFHCSPAIEFVLPNRNVVLRWSGLQVQPEFAPVAEQPFTSFGDSWDCVGFVSPGIVSGLFVVIMLLFILSIGISWMMDINTMDRFDDPKGKTITISVTE